MKILKSLFIRNSVAPGDEEGREPKTWKEIIALMLFNFICQKSISIQNFINPDNWFGKCGEGIDVSNQEREIDICGRQCERRQRRPFLLWRYSALTGFTSVIVFMISLKKIWKMPCLQNHKLLLACFMMFLGHFRAYLVFDTEQEFYYKWLSVYTYFNIHSQ